ncbi:AHH domain-containing protein [Microbulbifer halophilus]|uniref:AHH domain-containing protein n=1 Tax=Microbulbifer halophilus TaxID=453963 RepID=A0ABW5EB00_9GAMM|nr:AHH domain-containing protein [Microbulbifer halophilus]MCW8125698.1 AHH domain-containing protein [Microbulbifer halophilus]
MLGTNPVLQSRVDRAIAQFADLENPTRADLNRVRTISRIEQNLEKYRKAGLEKIPEDELKEEKHKSSRLGRHMLATGDAKPHSKCHAHAIVAGGAPEADATRAVLAWFQVRIDDPTNGCWLPGTKAVVHMMPHWLQRAAPHLSLHRGEYYEWVSRFISLDMIGSREDLIRELKFLEHRLQSGAFPPEIVEGRKY